MKFSSEQASDWMITIIDQRCQVEEGTTKGPDLTIRTNAEDGVKLFTGKLDVMRIFMMGRLRVSGNLTLGMELTSFFS